MSQFIKLALFAALITLASAPADARQTSSFKMPPDNLGANTFTWENTSVSTCPQHATCYGQGSADGSIVIYDMNQTLVSDNTTATGKPAVK